MGTKTRNISNCTPELSCRFKNIALMSSFFVVALHCATQLQLKNSLFGMGFCDGLCRVAVPFFFFMSGFFLAGSTGQQGWWKSQVKKRVYSLLLPYLLFISLYWVLHIGGEVVANLKAGRFLLEGVDLSIMRVLTVFGFNPLCHPYLLPLWYVRALFILVLLSPGIVGVMFFAAQWGRRGVWVLLFLIYGVYGVLGPYEGGGFYVFRKFLAFQGLFYLSCGMAFRYGFVNIHIKSVAGRISMVVLGLCLLVLKVYAQQQGSGFYVYLGWLSVPVLMITIFNYMVETRFPIWIVSCSFPIYLVHMFFVRRVADLSQKCSLMVGNSAFLWLFVVTLIFVVSLLTVAIQRKIFPSLNRWLWGGR